MKMEFSRIGLSRLCQLLGVTRQAYYQHFWSLSDTHTEEQSIINQVKEIRELHPAIGGRKLLFLLQSFLLENQIKMGRDALFDLLAAHKLLVKRRRLRITTTYSRHWLRKYPSLIKEWQPQRPNQLWVADITYVPITKGTLFLSLITDAYSHKIMGYSIAKNLEGKHTFKALDMALRTRTKLTPELIHHSDRGMQYCAHNYTGMLYENNIKISMTEKGDPLENALAERLNGIVKNEYFCHYNFKSHVDAEKMLPEIVRRYNKLRPHLSINMKTPDEVHEKELLINRTWERRI
jgi:transposase InsO family protein